MLKIAELNIGKLRKHVIHSFMSEMKEKFRLGIRTEYIR